MCIRAGVIVALLVAVLVGTANPAAAASEPTVLVGIAGLRWSDVSAERTPALYRLAERATLGTLSVRAVDEPTCPLDGWLTLSAGARSTGPHPCRAIPEPMDNRVPEWVGLADLQEDTRYQSRLGRLGDALAADDDCANAVGPGAGYALAGSEGRLAHYASRFDAGLVDDCPLTVIDAGALSTGPESRRTKELRNLDRLLARVVEAAGPDGTVLVAGLADEPDADRTSLRLGLVAGPGYGKQWLGSTSTRQDGLGQLTDLTPTLTGADTGWHAAGERPSDLPDAIAELRGFDTAERVIRQQSVWLYGALVLVQALAYGIGFGLRRRGLAVAVAAVAGSVPVAAFLVNLLPWPTSPRPSLVLWSGLLGFAVLLGVVATRTPKPALTIAAVTSGVLALDVLTGSHLQGGTLLTPGDLPVVGGRFFGLGNVGFAIFATSALLVAGGVAGGVAARGPTRRAWLAALGIGAIAVVVDGWPGWGADFGGVLALVPGVVVLGCGVAGVRLRVRHLLLAGLAAVGAVGVVAIADWLRPAEQRSHLGGFVQRVLDGQALPVIVRKAEVSLSTVTAWHGLGLVVVVAYVAAVLLVLRRDWFGPLAPTLRALLVVGAVGFAVNDSGLVVPAVVLLTGTPLVVLALTREPEPEPQP